MGNHIAPVELEKFYRLINYGTHGAGARAAFETAPFVSFPI